MKMMMKCFRLSIREDANDAKVLKSVSVPSSTSVSTDMRRFDSEVTSQSMSVSEVSVDSGNLRHPFAGSMSESPNDLECYSLADLKLATKNFARGSMIGEGGFGGVYKGLLRSRHDRDNNIHVAVKQLSLQGMQGHKEWVTEVNVLGVVEHQNLVKLLGYCADDDERGIQRLLIYEYMTNRSVMDHLTNTFQHSLPWSRRLKIAQDTARGLSYLHEGMDFQIIFRDFKSSNILLDEEWNAKLSDFGLARLGPEGGLSHVSTAVVGTIGYAAPEYLQTGHLTYKSDVWSYGVFLYELITGRKPVDRNRSKSEQKLLDWVRPHLSHPKKFMQIIDPRLEGKHIPKSAQKLASIANKCLSRQPKLRPKMSEVLEMVTALVEWTETECPQSPLRNGWGEMSAKEILKRKLVDPIIGENGCLVRKSWRPRGGVRAI